MKNVRDIQRKVIKNLDKKDILRELVLRTTRNIVRESGELIREIHRGNDVKVPLKKLKFKISKLKNSLKNHPDLYYSGFVDEALQEYSEAIIVFSILNHETLPDPEEIKVHWTPYMLGLGDSIGEFRRLTLNALRRDNLKLACKYLDIMEELYELLMAINYPDGLIPIRRKQDIARGLLEKTRGEVAVAIKQETLIAKLEDLQKNI